MQLSLVVLASIGLMSMILCRGFSLKFYRKCLNSKSISNCLLRVSTSQDYQQQNNSDIIERLESLKLDDLKAVYKKLGGKPSGLKKSDLIGKCHDLLAEKVKKQNSDFIPTNINHISELPTSFIKDTSTLQAIGKVRSYQVDSNLLQHSMSEENIRTETGSSYNSVSPSRQQNDSNYGSASSYQRTRYPVGMARDSRLIENENADMELTFLGTASCIPTVTRGVSCVCLRRNSDLWLFDCGESTQLQIQKSSIKVSKINKIFITHAHGDHSFGLPGVMCLMGQSRQSISKVSGDVPEVIDIYGPTGIRDYVRAVLQLTYSKIGVPHRIHELKNVPHLHGRFGKLPQSFTISTAFSPEYGEQEGGRDIYPDENGHYRLFEEDGVEVMAAPLQHTVPCVGFVINEKPRQGSLRIDKVKDLVEKNSVELKKQLNLSDARKAFAILKDLKYGQDFVFPDGTRVLANEIIEPEKPGRKIVVLGDTCNSDLISPLAKDADILIHESTNAWIPEIDSGKYAVPNLLERDAFMHGHSTPQMAGRFAKKINAKKLLLTHFSPRYRGDDGENSMQIMWRIEDMARHASGLLGKNEVIAAWDLMKLPINSKPLNETDEVLSYKNATVNGMILIQESI